MIDTMPRRDQPQPKPALANVPMSIRLTRAEREGLGAIAYSREVSVGTVIREAIDGHLSRFVDADGRTLLEAADDGDVDVLVDDFDLESPGS